MQRSQPRYLLAVGVVLVVVVVGLIITQLTSPTSNPGSKSALISDVRVSYVTSVAVTVTWVTAEPATGQVIWGTSPASIATVVDDRRGKTFTGVTHFIQVGNLRPDTTYYLDVRSNGQTDNNKGQHFQVKTGPDLGVPGLPNIVYGKVLQPGGQKPAAYALLFLKVSDPNQRGAKESQTIVTITGPDGSWGLDLGVRSADLSTYMHPGPSAQIHITVQSGPGRPTAVQVAMKDASKPLQITLAEAPN